MHLTIKIIPSLRVAEERWFHSPSLEDHRNVVFQGNNSSLAIHHPRSPAYAPLSTLSMANQARALVIAYNNGDAASVAFVNGYSSFVGGS